MSPVTLSPLLYSPHFSHVERRRQSVVVVVLTVLTSLARRVQIAGLIVDNLVEDREPVAIGSDRPLQRNEFLRGEITMRYRRLGHCGTSGVTETNEKMLSQRWKL